MRIERSGFFDKTSPWSLRLLIAFLAIFALWLAFLQVPLVMRWPPTTYICQPFSPAGLHELIALSKELGYPGFQLAWINHQGERGTCVAGYAQMGFWSQPLTPEHRLRYASLTKIFTATVAMQLITEQRLDLNDRLVENLDVSGPYHDPRIAEIRIANLLEHTAGFDRNLTPDPMWEPDPWCPKRLDTLASLQLNHAPGTVYAYANLGYCLLGAVIERIEQKPLEKVFSQRLFIPAQISSIRPAITGQLAEDEPTYSIDPNESLDGLLYHNYAAGMATGAFTGTAEDFLDFLVAAFHAPNPLISSDAQARMLRINRPCDLSQWRTCHGYGLYAYRAESGSLMYWRDGSLPGVTAFAALFEDGSIVVFLANSRRYNWMPDHDRLGQWLYQQRIRITR